VTAEQNGAPVDPYKAQLRATWDGLGPAWQRWQDFFERGAKPVTDWMVNAVRVATGDRVLDVATGAGEPALTVADLVGPTGRVVGIDQSPKMVEAARNRAEGRDNTTFRVDDVDQLDAETGSGYDVVLSRFGLMFAQDLPKALVALAGVLNSGGHCAIAAWSVPPRAPIVSLGFGVAARKLELPPPPPQTPGPFSMADPEPVLDALRKAGFVDVRAQEVQTTFQAASVDEFIDYCQATLPGWLAARLAERFGTDRGNSVWSEIAEAVAPYVQPDGQVALPSIAVCFAGRRPSPITSSLRR